MGVESELLNRLLPFLLILAHSTDTTNTPTRQHLIIPQYKKTDKELSLNCITPNRDSPLTNH